MYGSLSFIAGITWGLRGTFHFQHTSIPVLIFLFVSFSIYRAERFSLLLTICLTGFVLGIMRGSLFAEYQSSIQQDMLYTPTECSIRIYSYPMLTGRSAKRYKVYGRIYNTELINGSLWALIYFPENASDICWGDSIRCTAILRKPSCFHLNRSLTYRDYLSCRSVFATAYITQYKVNKHSLCSQMLSTIKMKMMRHLSAGIGQCNESELIKAMILGTKPQVGPNLLYKFSVMGIIHILVISGLHIGCIAFFGLTLLTLCRVPHKTAKMIMMPLLTCYTALVGFKVSVVRALVMICWYWASDFFRRERNPIYAVISAAVIQLIWFPMMLYDHGFQYSFLSILGILYIYPLFKLPDNANIASYLLRYPLLSSSVLVMLMPLSAYRNSYFSPVSFLLGAVVVGIGFMIIIGGVLSICVGFISLELAAVFNAGNYAAIRCIINLNSLVYDILDMRQFYHPVPVWWFYLYYTLIAAILIFIKDTRYKRYAIIAAFAGIMIRGIVA